MCYNMNLFNNRTPIDGFWMQETEQIGKFERHNTHVQPTKIRLKYVVRLFEELVSFEATEYVQ